MFDLKKSFIFFVLFGSLFGISKANDEILDVVSSEKVVPLNVLTTCALEISSAAMAAPAALGVFGVSSCVCNRIGKFLNLPSLRHNGRKNVAISTMACLVAEYGAKKLVDRALADGSRGECCDPCCSTCTCMIGVGLAGGCLLAHDLVKDECEKPHAD